MEMPCDIECMRSWVVSPSLTNKKWGGGRLVWWLTPIIPAFIRLRQKDCHKFEANLGYILSTKLACTTE